jgi:hypothetical protein
LSSPRDSSCLNCGAELHGAFCSACGQRVIPAYPTVRQLVGDAWEELSGYDGRFVRTFRRLLRRPGEITLEVMEGRRARYISPVRLYLVASVAYFLVAAAVPNLRVEEGAVLPGSSIKIGPTTELSAADREEAVKEIEDAAAWRRPFIRAMILDPAAFRTRFVTYLPRVLFALVPVFAGILALFYRRRRFTQHLVFALHVHAMVFIVLTAQALANVSHLRAIVAVVELVGTVFIVRYVLLGLRRVYGGSWMPTLARAAGIAVIYLVAGVVGLVAAIALAVVT